MALQLVHGFNFQICVCNRGEKEREQVRLVSMLIIPLHVRFVFSRSTLYRVFTAHSPRNALGTCILERHRFIWGITPMLLCRNKSYSDDLQHERVRKY